MAEEKLDKLGPIMNAIGAEGARIVGGDPEGLYIYAEPDDGTIYAGVFKDEGTEVRYFDPTDELFDLIIDAWEAESSDEAKRWAVLEYEVRDMKFDADFGYPEEFKPFEYSTDRREAALKRRYGDKPIVYPPPSSDEFMELQRD